MLEKLKKLRILWVLILVLIIAYFAYQNYFVSVQGFEDTTKDERMQVDDDHTVLLEATESNLTLNTGKKQPMTEEMKFWEYDDDNKQIKLRDKHFIPSSETPLLMVYNSGWDDFEQQENILSIAEFPYFVYQSASSLQVQKIDEEGNVFISFQNKTIKVKPGQTYHGAYVKNLSVRHVKIKNYGIFKKEQFQTFEEVNDSKDDDDEGDDAEK